MMKNEFDNMQTLDELLETAPKTSQKSPEINDIIKSVQNGKYSSQVIEKYNLGRKEIEENLLLLLDYQNDRAECEGCKGLDMCTKPHPYFQVSLDEYGGYLNRKVGPCPYYKKVLKLRENYYFKQFNQEWLNKDPRNFGKLTMRVLDLWKAIENTVSKPDKNWFYLNGDFGSGRSYLTAIYCNLCAKKGKKISFISSNECFQQLKDDSIKNHDKFEKDMEMLIECDLLVIDDFGSEMRTNYVRDSILLPILNGRSKNKKPIIFISDFTLREIQALYSFDFQAKIVAKFIGNLINSNLGQSYKLLNGMETSL